MGLGVELELGLRFGSRVRVFFVKCVVYYKSIFLYLCWVV